MLVPPGQTATLARGSYRDITQALLHSDLAGRDLSGGVAAARTRFAAAALGRGNNHALRAFADFHERRFVRNRRRQLIVGRRFRYGGDAPGRILRGVAVTADEAAVDLVADADHACDCHVALAVIRRLLFNGTAWVGYPCNAVRRSATERPADGPGYHIVASSPKCHGVTVTAHQGLLALAAITLTGSAFQTGAGLTKQTAGLGRSAGETLTVSMFAEHRRAFGAAIGLARGSIEAARKVALALIDN
jgi:hypothetical protein